MQKDQLGAMTVAQAKDIDRLDLDGDIEDDRNSCIKETLGGNEHNLMIELISSREKEVSCQL
jgi:hypothetical protein